MNNVKGLLALVVLIPISLLWRQPVAADVPVDAFARPPVFSQPKLSPDGRMIAAMVRTGELTGLVIYPLTTAGEKDGLPTQQVPSGKYKFDSHDWANNDTVLISVRVTTRRRNGYRNSSRIFSYKVREDDFVEFKTTDDDLGRRGQASFIVSLLENNDEHVLASVDIAPKGWGGPEVHLVDVRKGTKRRKMRNDNRIAQWLADYEGNVRIGVSYRHPGETMYTHVFHKRPDDVQWEEILYNGYFDQNRLVPMRFDRDDPNILLVETAGAHAGTPEDGLEQGLLRYDLAKREVTGPHIDTHLSKVIASVRRGLPGQKIELTSHDRERQKYIFRAHSDVDAPRYYFFDVVRNELGAVGSEYPELDSFRLATTHEISYAARDGRKIPAYLTLPNGGDGKNLPLVVYPHGAVWTRDYWGFNAQVQFLASQGYAVLQPQFRGSSGQGPEHRDAGIGEWGQTIIDDIADGAHALIAQGIADPGRLCIIGHGFGAYAALMGAAREPGLYQCVISVNGVTDVGLLLKDTRYTYARATYETMWHDPYQRNDISPYTLAEQIESPVLLLHGQRNSVFRIRQSRKMHLRLDALGKPSTLREYPAGEHWRTDTKSEIAMYREIANFLHEHIGN